MALDISQVMLALHEYENLKGAVPALKAEQESIQKMIEKARELAKVELNAYEAAKQKRDALERELGEQKKAFVAEKAAAVDEIARAKAQTEELLRTTKLMKVDIDAQNAALKKAQDEYKADLQKLNEKIALIAEVVKKIS